MEIIRQGRLPEDYVHESTCTHCRTTVRYKRSEGKIVDNQRDGTYVTVKCPTCDHDICSALSAGR